MTKLRVTKQRELILRELQNQHTHLTADELYAIVKKSMPTISLATVYRNLEILSTEGIIGKIEIGGRQKLFDYNPQPHHHILCTRCRKVENLEIYDDIIMPTALPHTLSGYRLEVIGICPHCQQEK